MRQQAESVIQSACVFWLRNMHPETHGCFFCVNNNAAHAASGVKNKSMGVIAGVSDCLFYWDGQLYCIEFKAANGRQRDEQKKWEGQMKKQGAEYHIIRNLIDFKELIESILKK